MSLNVARIDFHHPVAVTAVLLCAAVISLKVYQTTPAPNVARLSPAVPAQHGDRRWLESGCAGLHPHYRQSTAPAISRLIGRLRLRVMCWTACP